MVSERTLRFKKEYVELHRKGMSPRKAAKEFRISPATAYRAIAQIAEENQISYESLLQRPGAGNFGHGGGKDLAPLAPINVSVIKAKLCELCAEYKTLEEGLTDLTRSMENDATFVSLQSLVGVLSDR